MKTEIHHIASDIASARRDMDTAWKMLERQLTQISALKDACNRSHRCWPSRWGWVLAAFLATYLIFMHSVWYTERQEMQSKCQLSCQSEWVKEREQLKSGCQSVPKKKPYWMFLRIPWKR